jgi:hypothetical protein
MNAETMRELVRRRPFQIRMTNGDAHTLRRPEFGMVVGSRLVVGYPDSDRIAILSLSHIRGIEATSGLR